MSTGRTHENARARPMKGGADGTIKGGRQSVLRIAAETMCDPRTIWRVYRGQPSNAAAHLRIRTAAEKLGIVPPPALSTRDRSRP